MIDWQKDALDVLRNARALASETSNVTLHQACGGAIEAMLKEIGSVPSDLWSYACLVRRQHGMPTERIAKRASEPYMEK